ncbi:MAG TPA: FliH/SctL family protein [bacterium]|nr:FliH/SctL family protein [bacterium]
MTPSYRRIPRVRLDGRKYPVTVDTRLFQPGAAGADGSVGEPEDEAAGVMQKAYEAGYQAGHSAATQAMERAVAAKAEALASMIDDVVSQRTQVVADSEESVVRLACRIAERIVEKVAEIDQETIVRVVKAALARLAESQRVTVRANPADIEALKQHKSEWLQATRGGSAVEIKEDERIRRGGCLIEGTSGNIEAEIDRQLEVIERALVEAVR